MIAFLLFISLIAFVVLVVFACIKMHLEDLKDNERLANYIKSDTAPEVKQPDTRTYPEGYGFDDGPVF